MSALLAMLLLAWPAVPQDSASQAAALAQPLAGQVVARRAEFLAIAERYLALEWTAGEEHVLHGADPDGVHVDTPDTGFREDGWVPGEVNVGMPYMWGGFDTPESFLAGLSAGRYAGQIPGPGAPPASAHAVGVDCSGFVSRCWDLPVKRSTRSFGPLVRELESYDELLPGDMLNNYDGHAVLFERFADDERTELQVVEATFPKVKRSTYPVATLARGGMKPLRYKPLDARWIRVARSPQSFVVAADAGPGEFEASEEVEPPADPMELALTTTSARAGAWARYRTDEVDDAELTLTVARADSRGLVLQSELAIGARTMETDATLGAGTPLVEALLRSAMPGTALEDRELVDCALARGTYTRAGRSFAARRLLVELDVVYRTRGSETPFRLTLEAILSDEVPGLGLLELRWQARGREAMRWAGGNVSRRELEGIGA